MDIYYSASVAQFQKAWALNYTVGTRISGGAKLTKTLQRALSPKLTESFKSGRPHVPQ